MLERMQEGSRLHLGDGQIGTRLHGAEKALAQWAIVDDYNAVLDMRCTGTALLRSLSQKFSLRACGITENAQDAHFLQDRLPNAEIYCARKEDIPWRDQCFDAVFYRLRKKEGCAGAGFLREAMRVLRPNGQLLIALEGMPEILCGLAELAGVGEQEDRLTPGELMRQMEEAGFGDVSYRVSKPLVGIAMGWKRE